MTPTLETQINIFRAHVDLLASCLDEVIAAMRQAPQADAAMVEMSEHHMLHGFDCMRRVFPTA